ncbi:Cystathionine gamma-lyase [Lamellibrachia satsuma]|nr:Cystathionine gamma-lyase [Lamellibrachia satsuma]
MSSTTAICWWISSFRCASYRSTSRHFNWVVEFAKKRHKRKNMRSTWYHNKGAKGLNPLEEESTFYQLIQPNLTPTVYVVHKQPLPRSIIRQREAMDEFKSFPHFATLALHAGQEPEQWNSRAVIPPISLSTTFMLEEPSFTATFVYGRRGNPTRQVTETCIASLEKGDNCFLFSSGMAAVTVLTQLLKAGDHIVSMNDLYGGTHVFFHKMAINGNIETSLVNATEADNVKAAMKPNTKMVWIETPSNPLMQIADIAAVCEVAHQQPGVFVVVDNTFATPYFQRPLELGADVVLHSLTKYMNGHSDVTMGALITSDSNLAEQIKFIQRVSGAVPSPFDCFLVNRGLKTLHLRMREHQKNGLAVAKYLESNPRVEKVFHPGLPSHPFYERAKKQMKGYSGVLSFYIKGGFKEAKTFVCSTKLFTLGGSLGGYESLVQTSATMTHAAVPKEERDAQGVTENLIRLSVGIEDIEDLIADVDQALIKAVDV